MKVTSFYSEGELSPIRVGSVDETVIEVKNLFFKELLEEDEIRTEVYTNNRNEVSLVDELRLDFDRIYTRKQIRKKIFFGRYKRTSLTLENYQLSIETLLSIKNEQRYLNAQFKNFKLISKRSLFSKSKSHFLFATLDNKMYYLLTPEKL